ncbi:DUF5615 family PIN-like protein [Dissulfurispira sp.]|uniref:DUF5615 family PIN-like protein n=1 Tax=Dissulfurispira sp. TaxID=2817609 RepID=UPI003FA5E729
MRKIKAYTDEDLDIAVSKVLKLRGFEASTTIEHGKSGSSDEEQLVYAASIGSVLLTHNVQDFPRIHYEFMKHGKHHSGILLLKNCLSERLSGAFCILHLPYQQKICRIGLSI